MTNIYGFLRFNKRKKRTMAIYVLCAWYRMVMLVVPSDIQQKYWGQRGGESPMEVTENEYRYAIIISRAVNRIADKTPWESKCLVRALTARRLLCRKGISNTLYLGVGKDDNGEMIAHAWLRCGEFFVTGGNGEKYSTVAKFSS